MATSSMQHTQFLRELQRQLIDHLLGRSTVRGLLANVLLQRRRKSELESVALSLTGRRRQNPAVGQEEKPGERAGTPRKVVKHEHPAGERPLLRLHKCGGLAV